MYNVQHSNTDEDQIEALTMVMKMTKEKMIKSPPSIIRKATTKTKMKSMNSINIYRGCCDEEINDKDGISDECCDNNNYYHDCNNAKLEYNELLENESESRHNDNDELFGSESESRRIDNDELFGSESESRHNDNDELLGNESESRRIDNDELHQDRSTFYSNKSRIRIPSDEGGGDDYGGCEGKTVTVIQNASDCSRSRISFRVQGRCDSNGCIASWFRMGLLIAVVNLLHLNAVSASCTKGVTELWAYSNPSFEEFTDSYKKYISSHRGAVCRWVVIASNDDWSVTLKFDPFQLKNSTSGETGDCVTIYNGGDIDSPVLDRLCNKKPAHYKSRGRRLYVVYERGSVAGTRKIGFVYKAETKDSKEELIRVAAIIGGSLAVLGVVYLIVRYTNCFGCFKKKLEDTTIATEDNTHVSQSERDRLTINVTEEGEVEGGGGGTGAAATRTANGSTTMLNVDEVEGGGDGAVGGAGVIVGDISSHSDSDSDSLHTLNEPPPSYESLYLNEDGGIEPPEYSPPRHKVRNPPRRVHTFN